MLLELSPLFRVSLSAPTARVFICIVRFTQSTSQVLIFFGFLFTSLVFFQLVNTRLFQRRYYLQLLLRLGVVISRRLCVFLIYSVLHSHISQIGCADCDNGRFSASNGASQCSLCPTGQMNPLARQSSCVNCSTGMHPCTGLHIG